LEVIADFNLSMELSPMYVLNAVPIPEI